MATALQARFGHEENFSRHLLESGVLDQLLKRVGLKTAGAGSLELPVRYGHKGHEGRLDIHQPTTAGTVIAEIQYGTSDSDHRNRFNGYLRSVSNPAAIVWFAERFRKKDLEAVAACRVPVLCAQVSLDKAGAVVASVLGGAKTALLSAEKKEAAANKKAWELVKAVDWAERLSSELYRRSYYAEPVTATDDEIVEWGLDDARLFAGTTPAGEKRLETIRTCGEARLIRDYIASFIPEVRSAVDVRFEEDRLEEQKWADELDRKNAIREQQEADWQLERAEQEKDDDLEDVKQIALDAYCEWLDDESLWDGVKEAYLRAEAACHAAGFRWLTGLPCVCTFIPERYHCGRPSLSAA